MQLVKKKMMRISFLDLAIRYLPFLVCSTFFIMHVKVAKIPGKFPGKLLSRFRFVEIARSHSHDVPLKVSLLDSSIICPNGVISFASIIFTEQISPAASQRTDLPQSRKLLLHLSY